MLTVDQVLAQIWESHQRGNYVGAEAAYRELTQKAPGNANAHVYLGIALFDLRRYDDAIASYQHALKLQRRFPIAWNNLGNALRMVGRIDEADQAFATALEQRPDYANAMKNRGTLWVWAGEIERGLGWYERVLKLTPDDPEIHRNLGVIYLLQGKFEAGWREYRYRWAMPGMGRPALNVPVWQGEPLDGKTIFVYPEQGLGDAIQFARMIGLLRRRGAEVVLGCEPKLVPLFSGLTQVGRIVPVGGVLGPVDYHASLVEVVDHSWGGEQEITGEAYLTVPENLVGYWSRWLSQLPGKRIGICWRGNPDHHADVYRSIALSALRPLAEVPGVSLVSLQFGEGVDQLQRVDFANRITRLPANVDQTSGAFLDTAAVIKNLDLVITSDTSCGHLAGALGVPTWLLLNKVPDWRWGMSGDHTPWYAGHKLYRQDEIGQWGPVVARMSKQLTEGI